MRTLRVVGFFDRFRARRSLKGITQPTRVRVVGTLVGSDSAKSRVTGRRGCAIEYRFWDRTTYSSPLEMGRPSYQDMFRDRLLGRGFVGDALEIEVEGSVLVVALEARVGIAFRGGWDPSYLPNLLPEEVAAAHPELEKLKGELCYDERGLHTGQEVRIAGYVEPVQTSRHGGYRGGAGAPWDFQARFDLGPVLVEELTL
ncbi:MAG: hypothetical protein AAGE52_36480 [Myxococcota bacterium]